MPSEQSKVNMVPSILIPLFAFLHVLFQMIPVYMVSDARVEWACQSNSKNGKGYALLWMVIDQSRGLEFTTESVSCGNTDSVNVHSRSLQEPIVCDQRI
jgi:hypothetical protein